MAIDRIDIRLMLRNEVDALRQIDVEARSRYLALAGYEKFANAAPIAGERFAVGLTTVAVQDDRILGFAILQTIDGFGYLANISSLPGTSNVGALLLQRAEQEAKAIELDAIVLTTFREPKWNGPWFRRNGFSTMPQAWIGPELLAILERHATFLDMQKRETLWKPLQVPMSENGP
jgi:N-acetylglutamate synthase-like GNAT family acetyltransferase